MARTIEEIKADLFGFTLPLCPDCLVRTSFDNHGCFCEQCGESVPNGAEFDDVNDEYNAACRAEADLRA